VADGSQARSLLGKRKRGASSRWIWRTKARDKLGRGGNLLLLARRSTEGDLLRRITTTTGLSSERRDGSDPGGHLGETIGERVVEFRVMEKTGARRLHIRTATFVFLSRRQNTADRVFAGKANQKGLIAS